MADDIGHALALFGNDLKMLELGFTVQRAGVHFHQATISCHTDDIKRLVQFVRHPGGHLPEGG